MGLLASCGKPEHARIERIAAGTELPELTFQGLTGNRDGDVLHTRAIFAGDSSTLDLELRFRIGVPTRLDEGSYSWNHGDRVLEGPVKEVFSTFLGGQSGPPSIGGAFELLSQQGERLFKVRIPVQEVGSPRQPGRRSRSAKP